MVSALDFCGRSERDRVKLMDRVIVTTYNRPDYLRLCLEYLSRAEDAQTKEVQVSVDHGRILVREIYEVVNDFICVLNLSVNFREQHSYMGNSMNALESYKEAYQSDAKFVYLVEDDVLVQPDFFKWHEAVQAQGDFMCSIAYRCSRNPQVTRDPQLETDPTAYFTSAQDYASIGVCWKRENLAPIVEHACEAYYQNMNDYILKHFPDNRFRECFTEQDGLIMRIMAVIHVLTSWPYMPRAWHFDVSGYHRLRSPRLSYQEIKDILHSQEKINMVDKDFHDIEAMPREPIPFWEFSKLHCVQRFE